MAATTRGRTRAEPPRREPRSGKGADQRPPLRRLVRVGVLVVVVLAWVYLVFGSEGVLAQLERHRERSELTAELDAERARTEEMRRFAEALRTDDLAIEREARALLDFQRPGEIVYIVEEEDPLLRAEEDGDGSDVH